MNKEMSFAEKKLKGVPIFGLNYLNRVKFFSEKFSEKTNSDKKILNCALTLHSIEAKKLIDFGLDFHFASALTAKKFLINSNEKITEINKIVHCIQNAGIKGKPESIEGKILQNAVLSEFLGSTGIAYSLYISGIKKNSSIKLINSMQNFLNDSNSVELLDSSKEIINERKKIFERFLIDLVNDFS